MGGGGHRGNIGVCGEQGDSGHWGERIGGGDCGHAKIEGKIYNVKTVFEREFATNKDVTCVIKSQMHPNATTCRKQAWGTEGARRQKAVGSVRLAIVGPLRELP